MKRWQIKFVQPLWNIPGDRMYLMVWLGCLTLWIHPDWQRRAVTIWKPGFRWVHGGFFGIRWWTKYEPEKPLPMPNPIPQEDRKNGD